METVTVKVGIVFSTLLPVIIFVCAVLNWTLHKRWFNLTQAVGLGLWVLLPVIRFAVPRLVGAYGSSLPSRLLSSGARLGFAVFVLGYLAMAIENRGSQHPAPADPAGS